MKHLLFFGLLLIVPTDVIFAQQGALAASSGALALQIGFGSSSNTLSLSLLGTKSGNFYEILANNDVASTNWVTARLGTALSNTIVMPFTNNAQIATFFNARQVLGIESQPSGLTVKPGSNVVLQVIASGNPILCYQWLKNGTNLTGATNSVLNLTNVSYLDRGIYSVTISNTFGSMTSAPAVLSVVMDWYATPKDGRSLDLGDGSQTNAWDLKNALETKGNLILAGDTLWLLDGTYHHSFLYGGSSAWKYKDDTGLIEPKPTIIYPNLSGANGNPITIRPFPGARAIIDGAFELNGSTSSYLRLRDLEIAMLTYTNRYTGSSTYFGWAVLSLDGVANSTTDINRSGVNLSPANLGIEIINCIVHDCLNTGLGGGAVQYYGCLVYNNGFYNNDNNNSSISAKGYGFYVQSKNPNAPQLIKNTIACNNSKGGLQANSQSGTNIYNNLWLDGLTSYQNGHLAGLQANDRQDDNAGWDLDWAYQGSPSSPFINCGFVNMNLWNAGQPNASTYESIDNSMTPAQNTFWFTNCIIACQYPTNQYGPLHINWGLPSTNVVCQNNAFYGGDLSVIQNQFTNNVFGQSCPTNGHNIIVQPNDYEPGRANIIIYNWDLASSVQVDLTGIGLASGDAYELHQCQDFFGDVTNGIFNGTNLVIQMTNHTSAQPVGINFHPAPTSFPQFGCFVIRKAQLAAAPPLVANVKEDLAQ